MTKYIFFAGLLLSSALTTAADNVDLDLEPCINGAVSAMGEFPEQELEDLVKSLIEPYQNEYALEPCINGGVSASGLYVNQDVEDAVQRAVAGQP